MIKIVWQVYVRFLNFKSMIYFICISVERTGEISENTRLSIIRLGGHKKLSKRIFKYNKKEFLPSSLIRKYYGKNLINKERLKEILDSAISYYSVPNSNVENIKELYKIKIGD